MTILVLHTWPSHCCSKLQGLGEIYEQEYMQTVAGVADDKVGKMFAAQQDTCKVDVEVHGSCTCRSCW